MRGDRPTPVRDVIITINGVTQSGTYFVQDSKVYVQSSTGTKVTQVGGSPAKAIAELLLSELVRS